MVSITTVSKLLDRGLSCDLLEKSYLCGINNNFGKNLPLLAPVVICLKSLTFVVSITTISVTDCLACCCDLLEKSYLCGINNNFPSMEEIAGNVVICLKSLTFVVSITTSSWVLKNLGPL